MTEYVGLDKFDLPACYRHHAATMADERDGTPSVPPPICSVMVEFYANGQQRTLIFGDTTTLNARENTSLLLETIGVLSDAAAGFNAQASN